MSDRVHKFLDILLGWIEKKSMPLIGLLLGQMVILNALEVASRYLMGSSIYWVHELSLLLVSWMTFLGIGVVYKQKSDAAVEMFVNLFSGKVKKTIILFITPIIIAFLLIFLWSAFVYVPIQDYPTPALGFPTYLFSVPFIYGLTLIILCLIRDMLVPAQKLDIRLPATCEGMTFPTDVDRGGSQ